MDTPVKNHSTSLSSSSSSSQFEDSPVFNYISNLSPIEPVKSGLNNHTLNSLNFASPPPVFASPQISSFSETRFSLKRHNFLDPLKLDSCESENGQTTEDVSLVSRFEKPTLLNSGKSAEETSNKTLTENLELAIELPNTLKYDSGSPDVNLEPSDAVMLESADAEVCLQSVVDDSEEGHSFKNDKDLRKICRVEQNKESEGSNWVKLISDSNNVLSIDSPISQDHSEEEEHRMVDSGTMSFISNFLDEGLNIVGTKDSDTQPEGYVDVQETDQTPAVLSSTLLDKLVVSDSCKLVDDQSCKDSNPSLKPSYQGHRTVRRRSLVFERTDTHKRKPICESKGMSSVTHQSSNNISQENDNLVQNKNGSGYLLSKLPGIGLHLNALASTKDGKVNNEGGDSESHLINTPRIRKPCASLAPAEAIPDNSLSNHTLDRALVLWNDEVQVIENTYQTSDCLVDEELEPSSPKNKRRKSETVGESLACKRCNCKRSKCLKLYCECFAAGLYCVEPCSCQDCLNKPIHENVVLETRKQIESRNPLAFAPKVIRSADAVSEIGEELNATPASARHKRGCNCRKSGCLKKYCECYQGGVGCSMSCRCIACKNTFGQKEGTEETSFRETKLETHQNPAMNANPEIVKDQDVPLTPSELGRPVNQSRLSLSKRPRMSALVRFVGPLQMGNRENPEKVTYGYDSSHLQMIPEDGTLEAIESSGCPQSSSVKSTSPNSKRVSPPYREFGSLTARRSGRKLILRSIPAFPLLSNHNDSSDF